MTRLAQKHSGGQLILYKFYDGLGQLIQTQVAGTTTTAVTYGYDATTPSGNKGKGQRTSMSDGSGSTTWEYGDNRGRLTKESKTISGSGTYVTQWAYDSGDQVTSMTYPDNEVVSYGYLPQMALNSVGGSSTYLQSSTYDAAGRVILRKMGVDQIRTGYNYNAWNVQGGRLVSVQSGTPNGNNINATLQNLSYSYDLNGNVTAIGDTLAGGIQTQSFGYDNQDRLTSAGASGGTDGPYATQSYSYDSNGRLLNGPKGNGYTYNTSHKHAVTTAGGTSYTYDNNGNMLTRAGYTFSYDAENRLVSVSGSATAGFIYDGDNQRVKGTAGGVTTVYIGNYYEVAGSTVQKYYYAGSQRIAMRSGTTLYWLLADHLGSTAVTVSGTTETGDVRYYPWGSERFTSGSTPTSFKYTGQRQESAIGLYYYGARWYDPALGRFVQPDTLVPDPGEAKSFDRYAYVLNNPLKYTDPTGHYSPEELMEHFGCDNLQCVTDHFGPNGDYAGQWGWFTILTQAQDGDQILAHSISSALNGAQLDSEFVGTFARVNGKIMIRVASTSDSNAATGERQTTLFDPDSLVAEKAAAAYGNLGSFGWYQLTGHKSVYASPQDKSVNCHYDDCVSLAIDGVADATSAVAVGCAAAAQPECVFVAGVAGKGLAIGSTLYSGIQTFVTHKSTKTDFGVTLTTSLVSAFAPPGVGAGAGVVQTYYDANALYRKPQ